MNYKVIPRKEETFEKACNGVIEAMAGIGGHTESFLYKDVNDGQSYLIASEWSSEDAFNTFCQSDNFKRSPIEVRKAFLLADLRTRSTSSKLKGDLKEWSGLSVRWGFLV